MYTRALETRDCTCSSHHVTARAHPLVTARALEVSQM